MATTRVPGDSGRSEERSGHLRRPPDLDRLVRVGKDANDICDMTGWVDARGSHPGDGVPRLLCYDGRWTLWYLARREDETVLTNMPFNDVPLPVTEDVALALAVFFLTACEECRGVAA